MVAGTDIDMVSNWPAGLWSGVDNVCRLTRRTMMDRRHTVVNSRRGYVQSSTLLLLSNLYKAPAASTTSQSGSFQRPNHPPARYQKLCMVTQRKLWAHDTRHRRGERQGLFILMNPVNSLRVPPDRQRTHFLSAQKRDRVNFQGPRRRLGR
jgi:hypothetical protein